MLKLNCINSILVERKNNQMILFERKAIDWITEHKEILFFLCISVLAGLLRVCGKDFVSGDMSFCLLPWYDHIKEAGGIKALGQQTGDYNLLYQTIIAIFTYIPIKSIYLYKAFSIIFDYVLAIVCSIALTDNYPWKKIDMRFNLVYASILLTPTVFLNSGYWGQCDVVYTSFVLLTILFLYREKYKTAFVMLGIAFSFKLQTIFIVPFVVALYFKKKNFSLLNFLISIAVFEASGILCYFQGRSIWEPFKLYLNQTNTYSSMWLNVPSFWWLVGYDYANLKICAILFSVILCGVGLYLIMSNKSEIITLEDHLSVAAWFVWTCLLFLPAMHERYTFPLDILLILLSFLDKKYLKYAIYSLASSLITYGQYLFGNQSINMFMVLIYIFLYVCFSVKIFTKNPKNI